ncbi:MAG TPA: serine hydrolase [Candidatus Binatia bacterium]|nr:serine hydrolase [Candidatus Binatia bacterium]
MRSVLWVVFAFLAGAIVVGLAGRYRGDVECEGFRHINPDYACAERPVIRKTSYAELVARINDLIEKESASGTMSVASVYFRDLRGGPVWGINESINFAPASLLKLPLVMTLFSLNENIPGLIDTEITFEMARIERFENLKQHELSGVRLEEGKKYRLQELARNAIVHSDNVSYYVLVDYFHTVVPEGVSFVTRTFQELGVIAPRSLAEEVVTARVYAALFRLLYNVSFLDARSSDTLLGWLADASFAKGLAAGVPEGTTVANKFGERDLPDGTQHLHDCGIVYYPDNPYLLCVMTKGRKWEELARVMGTISRMVWEEVDSRRQ